jgi:nanoRNase/pAp phosphatase (c-di-AMP/oligoRNAs hydrolase)
MGGAGKSLADLVAVIQRPGSLIVVPHDNPDPDALACAAALRYIAKSLTGKEATIALGGFVGRAENRAMVRYLSIPLVPAEDLPLGDPSTIVALVDTQPGRTNNSLPDGVRPDIVIDHHPAYVELGDLPFSDLREGYGATATILTEYLRASRLPVETKIATALFYGIMAETQDLGREASAVDMEASHFLYPHTNKRRLSKIENARVPPEYFCGFRDAIQGAMIYDKAIIAILGELRYPDMVAEMADFLLRLEGMEWAAAIGHHQDLLYVSLRTTQRDVNAGAILQNVLGSEHAGGHDMIAGGRIRLVSPNGPWIVEAERVKQRLLDAVGAAGSEGVPLGRQTTR